MVTPTLAARPVPGGWYCLFFNLLLLCRCLPFVKCQTPVPSLSPSATPLTMSTNETADFMSLDDKFGEYTLFPYCLPHQMLYCVAVNKGNAFDLRGLLEPIVANYSNYESNKDLGGYKLDPDEVFHRLRDEWLGNYFSDTLIKKMALPMAASPSEFMEAGEIGLERYGDKVNVTVIGVGVQIEKISDVDYGKGTFVTDLKVFLSDMTPPDAYAPFHSLREAINATQRSIFDTNLEIPANQLKAFAMPDQLQNYKTVLRNGHTDFDLRGMDGKMYARRLKRPYSDTYDVDPANFTPIFGENGTVRGYNFGDAFLDSGNPVPLRDGMCSNQALATSRPITKSMYESLQGGVEVVGRQRVDKPQPVYNSANELSYLKYKGVKIDFKPFNADFFPFQIEVLDIELYVPHNVKEERQHSLCIVEHFTGIAVPFKGINDQRDQELLRILPFVSTKREAPWLDNGHQMSYGDKSNYEGGRGDRIVQSVTVRVIYDQPPLNGWMILFPFLFSVFTTQLQWFVMTATSIGAKDMVSAILIIQNIIGSQRSYVGTYVSAQGILPSTIYLSYAITGVYITIVALMAAINIAREAKSKVWLVKHQGSIFRCVRMFCQLLTFFFIPVLVYERDPETGFQQDFKWLWYLVAGLVAGFYCLFLFSVLRQARRGRQDAAKMSLDHFEQPVYSWSVDEVAMWIEKSPKLSEVSTFTEGELTGIAEKFRNARISGESFLEVSTDSQILVKDIGVAVGEALHLSSVMSKIIARGYLNLDQNHGDDPDGDEVPFKEPFFDTRSNNSDLEQPLAS